MRRLQEMMIMVMIAAVIFAESDKEADPARSD
jgi:hypothetical protein